LSAGENLLSLVLAVFLLVIGIRVTRGLAQAVEQHWIYVWAKIPLVFLAGVTKWWMTVEMMRQYSTPTGGMTTPPALMANWIVAFSVVIGALFALAYPVSLIFILSSRSVKAYARGTVVG
jgi:hypothetical protein